MPVAAHYLEILDQDGIRIDGESEGHKHEGQIDVIGWDWEVTDQAAKNDAGTSKDKTGGKASGGGGKASAGGAEVGIEPSLLTFRKPVDRSTIRLMKAMYGGEVLNKATFTLFEELVGGDDHRRVGFQLDVVLEKVTVVGYELGGRSSEFRVDLDETWQLNYATISIVFVSAGGMNTSFDRPPGSDKGGAVIDRPPGSEKGGAAKAAADSASATASASLAAVVREVEMLQKKIAGLEKATAAAGKGTRG